MVKLLKRTEYIDTETGETWQKENWVDLQFNDQGYLLFKSRKAVKSYIDIPLPDTLSWADQGKIALLQHYILRDNQLLVYRSGSRIKPLDTAMMAKITRSSERQTKSFIRRLKQCNIIREAKVENTIYYCYNPLYGMQGKRLTVTVYIIWQDVLRETLPDWVVDRFIEQAQDIDDIEVI